MMNIANIARGASAQRASCPVSYACSDRVRDLLVLLALSATVTDFTDDLQEALDTSLRDVTAGIGAGTIRLDYLPCADGNVDIPAGDHPHYMQALLYWCAELDCPLPRLVEAHARLGMNPARDQVVAMVGVIEREDRVPDTGLQVRRRLHGVLRPTLPAGRSGFQDTWAWSSHGVVS